MERTGPRRARRLAVAAVAGGIVLGTAGVASADRLGPITFEPPAFTLGTINGQQGWSKTGPYDAQVAAVAAFPDAAGYGFGAQALRISNAVTSGSFGDQTFSPGLRRPAGETLRNRRFEARFRIGTTSAAYQPGARITVSPDDGQGSRMSFLAFEDKPDGVHVVFFDVANPGPFPKVSEFVPADIATISRGRAHTVRFSLHLRPGPANDTVRIYIDGKLRRAAATCATPAHGKGRGKGARPCHPNRGRSVTGTTWEDYYRYDPEQIGNGNRVPVVSHLLFRVSSTPAPATVGQGLLIDKLVLWSSNVPGHRRSCRGGGWKAHTRADGTAFRNAAACIRYADR
jgi:hypothetical protein